jgi:hypothetical protein
MILYIDFSSYGDAGFYLNYWKKVIKTSDRKFFIISHKGREILNKQNISLPLFFHNYKILHYIYKFLIQSFVILIVSIFTYFLRNKIHIIFNLHQPFIFWNWLLTFSNKQKTIFHVIVHDIVEFNTSNYPSIIISNNNSIISNSDNVIIHDGLNSFKHTYGASKKIISLPFPSRLPYNNSKPIINSKYYYIPGQYRLEKGFDFVIKYWPIDKTKILVISTKLPEELHTILKLKNNILYKPHLIKSNHFQNLITNSFACIMMYSSGTNSGVLTTLIANNVRCLVSNIHMFKNHYQSSEFILSELNEKYFLESLSLLENKEKPKYINPLEESKKYVHFLKSLEC